MSERPSIPAAVVLAVEGPAKKDTGETLVGQVNTSFESFVISISMHFSIF